MRGKTRQKEEKALGKVLGKLLFVRFVRFLLGGFFHFHSAKSPKKTKPNNLTINLNIYIEKKRDCALSAHAFTL